MMDHGQGNASNVMTSFFADCNVFIALSRAIASAWLGSRGLHPFFQTLINFWFEIA